MPLRPSVAEKLHVVTLSLEQAITSDDWPALTSLLDERGRLLETLETEGLTVRDRDVLTQTHVVEKRCEAMLKSIKSEVLDSIRQSFQTRQARSAYQTLASSILLDCGGL